MVTNNSSDISSQGTVYYDGIGTMSGLDGSTAGFVLTSNGTGVAPSFQAASSGGITQINGDTGSITGSTVSIIANVASFTCGATVQFENSGNVSVLNVTDPVNANTMVGLSAGVAVTGITNTVFGQSALSHASAGTVARNVIIGYQAGQSIQKTTGTEGSGNTVVGHAAWSASVNPGLAQQTTAIGTFACAVLENGDQNCCVGFGSGIALTTGSGNTFLGAGSGQGTTTGGGNLLLGNGSGSNLTGAENDNVYLNAAGTASESNVIRIADSTGGGLEASSCFIGGIAGVSVSNKNIVTINTSTGQLGSDATVAVAQGGTGAATLTGLLTGNGTSPITGTAITQYNVITGGASNVPNSVAPSATSGIPLISQGSSSQPIFGTSVVAGGGTGSTSFNINGVVISNTTTTGALSSLTLTNGQVVIGSTGNPPAAATLTAGSGISITNGANSITIASTTGGFTWTDVTGATQTFSVNNGYITDRSGGVTYTLPSTASLGDTIKVVGKAGIATITPNANQQILIGATSGTVGATGTAVSNNAGDCITLVCITSGASTVWRAETTIGTWTLS